MMKDLKMYIQMLNLAPLEDHSGGSSPAHNGNSSPPPARRAAAARAASQTRSSDTLSPQTTPRQKSRCRAPPVGALAASAIGAEMARRELELSLAAVDLSPPVQPLRPAAPDERPPQPAAALPSTLPHGLAQDLETTQDSTAAEAAIHGRATTPHGHNAAPGQTQGAAAALREYADVADLPFVPAVAKRSNPVATSDSDGPSSLAPPGTSKAVMEIKEDASRALSTHHAAAAALAMARSTRDAFSLASTPEGSAHGPYAPVSSRTAPGTIGDGDSAPCLCSSPRGAEQLFLHKSPSHKPGTAAKAVTAAAAKASPDTFAAAQESYAIDQPDAAALPWRPGTAAAAPASGASAGTTASAATAPADLAAAAATLPPPPPRNGLQPQPVSRPSHSTLAPHFLYGKLTAPPSATPGSPVNRQSSAASASTSVSSGHKLPAYRLRPQPPAAPASPARRPGSRTSSQKNQAMDDLSNKFGATSVSVTGSVMSATAMSATGAMAGLPAVGKPAAMRQMSQPSSPGCSLRAIFCRGTSPRE